MRHLDWVENWQILGVSIRKLTITTHQSPISHFASVNKNKGDIVISYVLANDRLSSQAGKAGMSFIRPLKIQQEAAGPGCCRGSRGEVTGGMSEDERCLVTSAGRREGKQEVRKKAFYDLQSTVLGSKDLVVPPSTSHPAEPSAHISHVFHPCNIPMISTPPFSRGANRGSEGKQLAQDGGRDDEEMTNLPDAGFWAPCTTALRGA